MLEKVKAKVWKELVVPTFLKRGYRQAKGIPLEDMHLRAEFGYDEEAEIKKALRRVRGHTMSSFERIASLWQQVRYLDHYKVAGDFVECGVWKGGSVGIMALAHLHGNKNPYRTLHLFDSFEGLPQPESKVDGHKAMEFARTTNDMNVGPLADNKRLLESEIGYPKGLLNYHVGWFKDTLPKIAPTSGPISLLRLDGDWYDSTKICLEHLYSKVVRGGVVVIDDYGHWEGCRKAVDEFLLRLGEPVLMNHIDYSGRCWVKI